MINSLKDKPIIHLYSICWNEEAMLEFFFRHYDKYVDKYVFYDDSSDDKTLEILNNHPNVEIRIFPREEVDSYVVTAQEIHDSCWKESKGIADWVIITPPDEYLYHPHLIEYLNDCKKEGISFIPALGYQMISESYPETGTDILQEVRNGTPWFMMNKMSVFDPAMLDETNYAEGRHDAKPEGIVKHPETDILLNLHCKYLSLEKTYQRHKALLTKLGKIDHEVNWAHRYNYDMAGLKADWDKFSQDLQIDVLDDIENAHFKHSLLGKRWWRRDAIKKQQAEALALRRKKKRLFRPWYFILDRMPGPTKLFLDRIYIKMKLLVNGKNSAGY